jgi:toxin YoeB
MIYFSVNAWEDYQYWQKVDTKVLTKINALIKEIKETPFEGTGKPEALKHDLAGLWSRIIYDDHRLVYQVKEDQILIYECRFHFDI